MNCETVGFVDYRGDLLAAPVHSAASWRICHELKIAEIKKKLFGHFPYDR